MDKKAITWVPGESSRITVDVTEVIQNSAVMAYSYSYLRVTGCNMLKVFHTLNSIDIFDTLNI